MKPLRVNIPYRKAGVLKTGTGQPSVEYADLRSIHLKNAGKIWDQCSPDFRVELSIYICCPTNLRGRNRKVELIGRSLLYNMQKTWPARRGTSSSFLSVK